MKRSSSLLIVMMICGYGSVAYAGAWSQPKGECYAKSWALGLVGSAAFDKDEGTFDTGSFQDFSLNYYAECGIFEKWTLLTTGRPVGYAQYEDAATVYTGRVNIGLRRSFFDGPVRLGVELSFGHQGLTGGENLVEDPAVRFTYRPVVRSSTARGSVAIGYGASWGWLTAETGLRVFGSQFLNTAMVGVIQAGWKISSKWLLDLHLPYHIQFEDIQVNNISGAGNTNYLGLGLGLAYWLSPDFGLNLGIDGVVFAQANASTPALQLGAEWRF